MLRNLLIACGVALGCGALAQRASAGSTFAFGGAVDRSGDIQGPLEIVNDFTVTSPTGINVTQLGIFIDGYDGFNGLSLNHVVSLYNRANTASPMASITIAGSFDSTAGPFAYNNPQNSNSSSPQVQGGFGYVNIPQIFLPNGFTGSIVAYMMSNGADFTDDYGDAATFNTGGGLISFTKSFHVASSGSTGDTASNQSNEVLGAGSFTFAAAPVQTPEPATLGVVGIAAMFALRRRRGMSATLMSR